MKTILGIVGGFVVWCLVGFVGLLTLKLSWPEYAGVMGNFAFTDPMLSARLLVGVLNSLAAGWAAYSIAKGTGSAWILGGILLAYASYMHFIVLWDKFPPWFHFSYVITLLPLIVLGGYLAKHRNKNNNNNEALASAG